MGYPESEQRHLRLMGTEVLVENMLTMHKQLASAKSEAETTVLQRQIASTDAEVDRLVYDLYGLTEHEIAIVEGKTQKSAFFKREHCADE